MSVLFGQAILAVSSVLLDFITPAYIFIANIFCNWIALEHSRPSPVPKAAPSPLVADGPSESTLTAPHKGDHHPYHLTLIPSIGVAVTVVAFVMLIVLVVLIRKKSKELEDSDNMDKTSFKPFPPPQSMRKFQEGLCLICSMLYAPSSLPESLILVLKCRSYISVPKIQLQGD